MAGLLLCLVATAAGGKEIPPAPAVASLTVHAGRTRLVQDEKVHTLTRVSTTRHVMGEAYAEVGPLGELEVAWTGSGSLRVTGPAALEWSPSGEVRVLRAKRIELEMRRGSRRLSLPGAWSVTLVRGAISAAETVGGDWILEHRGGADLPLVRDRETQGVLASGGRVLLPIAR